LQNLWKHRKPAWQSLKNGGLASTFLANSEVLQLAQRCYTYAKGITVLFDRTLILLFRFCFKIAFRNLEAESCLKNRDIPVFMFDCLHIH